MAEYPYPFDRFAGEPFLDVEKYILRKGDLAVPIPGTDVCIDGDQLRTKEPFTITQNVTDHSQCKTMELSDSEKQTCASGAHSTVVVFEDYLSSPLTYSLKTCLEYDDSHCRILELSDTEREICRGDFKYEGIWAEGTIFDYKCIKWEARTYSHPLQYTIRYLLPDDRDDDGPPKLVEVHRVTKSVSRCRAK